MNYEVEGVNLEAGHRKLGVRSQKMILRPDKHARKMLWTIRNAES